ncbi:hypothetical protein [Mesomycoplasma molare]|uniref:Lipoprotein n=1 Tax=Mesomycoplasma molare TaxID=171288 RepID=A0ABY5TV38_9BACT|nr:hypothetical protein [Mesomycoplasma molare]UWD34533.1 hypothetical protein NX772_01745 [Mesomycoplasma molare]
MKKSKKAFLLLAGLSPILTVVSCQVQETINSNNGSNNANNNDNNKASESNEDILKQLIDELNLKISSNKKLEFQLSLIENKANKEKLLEIQKSFNDYLSNLKIETIEKYANKLVENKEALISKLNQSETENKINESKKEIINELNKQKESEYNSKKAEFSEKIETTRIESRKDKLKKELEKVLVYTDTFAFEEFLNKELELDATEFAKIEKAKLDRSKILAKAYIEILEESNRPSFETKLDEAKTEENINSIISEIKNSLNQTDTNVLSRFKNVILSWIEKLTDKKADDKITTFESKANKTNATFENHVTTLGEVISRYSKELETIRTRALTRSKSLSRYDSEKGAQFSIQAEEFTDKTSLEEFSNNILTEIRKYKPYIELEPLYNPDNDPKLENKKQLTFEYLKDFFITSAYTSTRVSSTTTFADKEYRLETQRTSRNNQLIKSGKPEIVRTYDLTAEDKLIRQKLFELKEAVIEEFYGTPQTVNASEPYKQYFFKNRLSEDTYRTTRINISRLLYTIDKAIIDGYFYEEVYIALSGTDLDGNILKKEANRAGNFTEKIPFDFNELKEFLKGINNLR